MSAFLFFIYFFYPSKSISYTEWLLIFYHRFWGKGFKITRRFLINSHLIRPKEKNNNETKLTFPVYFKFC